MSIGKLWEDRAGELGTATDQELADRYGCSRQRVFQVRQILKIAAFTPPIDWEQVDPHLGTATDTELAERIGCHPDSILKRRRFKMIGRWRRSDDPDYGRAEYESLAELGHAQTAETFGLSVSCLQRRAHLWARRADKPWPIFRPSRGAGATAYQLWMSGADWPEIATRLKYKTSASARGSAYEWARRAGKPMPSQNNREKNASP